MAEAIKAPDRSAWGALGSLGREVGLTDEDATALEQSLQRLPAVPVDLDRPSWRSAWSPWSEQFASLDPGGLLG